MATTIYALNHLDTEGRRSLIRTDPHLRDTLYDILDRLVDCVLSPPTDRIGLCGIMKPAYSRSGYLLAVLRAWPRFWETDRGDGTPSEAFPVPHPRFKISRDAFVLGGADPEEFWGYDYEYGRNRWELLVHYIDTICADLEHEEGSQQ